MDMNKKEELLERANFILQDGVKNRDSLFHTLVLSSCAMEKSNPESWF